MPCTVFFSRALHATAVLLVLSALSASCGGGAGTVPEKTPNPRLDGYHGIWHADLPSDDEYRYIYYSGGLGTSTAKHLPMAYYAPEVGKTFFCWGGARPGENKLLQMISCFDHASGTVPRPVVIMEKDTDDHHDNPAMMLDDDGYIWIFVSAHGRVRYAYIYRGAEPYSIDSFELVSRTNFSYPQPWHIPGRGFLFLHTRYIDGRHLYWMTSPDGRTWSEPRKLSAIDEGHYQVSWRHGSTVGTAFNYHPASAKGGNWDDPEKAGADPAASGTNNRTNLYYLETDDFGETWRTAAGKAVTTPLTDAANDALVFDYRSRGLLVYMKDLAFDGDGNPVILYVTSRGSESGPRHDPRTWTVARWRGGEWVIGEVTTSDNNYDMGSIFVERDGTLRIVGPTETGPQPYNCGGEVAMWTSIDGGATWRRERLVTAASGYNHSYVRKPVNAHRDFLAFWADGDGRGQSPSRLYLCDGSGRAFMLPERMREEWEKPAPLRIEGR